MADYHSFDEKEVQDLIDTAANHYSADMLKSTAPGDLALHASPMKLGETCIALTVENGKVCLKLPVVDKNICLPIPSFIPNGTAAQACLKICTTLGFPTGVCVTVSALGKTVVHQCFGAC
ncbi:hypothetical protein [Paracoccus salsus]|uniref:hypothetical protein n=1 Tax=Paracoccus salsus TaxID=2911061 RepID=UPI001F283D25|nr:hypothetical protein [Paracoccus salsus]MCF3973370.1 hypothetical protein [Paracoccus salsus]